MKKRPLNYRPLIEQLASFDSRIMGPKDEDPSLIIVCHHYLFFSFIILAKTRQNLLYVNASNKGLRFTILPECFGKHQELMCSLICEFKH